MIEGLSNAKFELAKSFFSEITPGEYYFDGINGACLSPHILAKVVNMMFNVISTKHVNEIKLVIPAHRDDIPLAFEFARRLGVNYCIPSNSGGYLYKRVYEDHKINTDMMTLKIPSIVVSFSFSTNDMEIVSHQLETEEIFEVLAYFAVQQLGTESKFMDVSLYSIFSSEQIEKIIEVMTDYNKSDTTKKFTAAVTEAKK
jgi:hypothetical protein